MTSKEKAKKLHEIADALEEWGKYNEKVTNAAEWGTPEAKQIIRKAMTLLVDNLVLLNECKNKYGCHSPLQQCFMMIEQVASWPKTKDLGDCRGWRCDFTERPLWDGEKRSFADECVRYANEVDKETEQRDRDGGDTYNITDSHVSFGDKAQHAGRDMNTTTPEPKKIVNELDNGSQSARATAIRSAAAELEQIANNFENWAKKHHAKYVDPDGVKPPAFTLAQIEDWVNTYLLKQRLVAVFFSHPHLSYDKNSGLTPFLTTYERKEFHLIIDVFRLHMPAIATSLKELYDEFWEDVRYHIECHERSKKVQQENIPSIGESIENTFWHPPLFLDGTVVSTVKRLRHIAKIAKGNLATSGPAETEQVTDKKIYKGEEAWKKFEEKLSEFGSLEIPFYPFKAGKIKYWNLTGKSDISKYGAYRFSKEDSAIIKNTVGSTFNVSELRAYLSAECNVQNLDNYSWKDILAALKHKLKTKTISETEQGTKREQEGMIKVRKPWYKKAWIWCLGFLSFIVLLTTAFLNLDTIIEKIKGETGKQTPSSKQSNETENTLHNPILVASASVEVRIKSDWDFNGTVANAKAYLAFVKGDKPLLITSSIGYTASQTGNGEVVYQGKLDMDAKDSAVGNPVFYLRDAEYVQIEFGRMPSDSYVLGGDAICIINNSVRLEFSIPPQKLVNNRIFIRNLSESLQVLNEPEN